MHHARDRARGRRSRRADRQSCAGTRDRRRTRIATGAPGILHNGIYCDVGLSCWWDDMAFAPSVARFRIQFRRNQKRSCQPFIAPPSRAKPPILGRLNVDVSPPTIPPTEFSGGTGARLACRFRRTRATAPGGFQQIRPAFRTCAIVANVHSQALGPIHVPIGLIDLIVQCQLSIIALRDPDARRENDFVPMPGDRPIDAAPDPPRQSINVSSSQGVHDHDELVAAESRCKIVGTNDFHDSLGDHCAAHDRPPSDRTCRLPI